MAEIVHELGPSRVDPVPIPHDCLDGILGAFWRRPESYLDPRIRSGMSAFALLEEDEVTRGVARLEADLQSGEWERRFGYLRSLETFDAGYCLFSTP